MKRQPIPLLAALAFAGVAQAGTATTAAATIVRQGNGHGAAPCMACHGVDGGGNAASAYPRLAGLPAEYLRRQLDDFASGARANALMQPNASSLSAPERAALATYYGALPIPTSAVGATPPPTEGVGAQLATRGDWSRGLPACVQCHGPGGVGVGAAFPPLADQSAGYLAAQLKNWQQGTRKHDPLQLMQHVASQLTPQEIQAVADWFAAQPATLKGVQP